MRRVVVLVAVAWVGGCGGPAPADRRPAWEPELDALRAAHFVDGEADNAQLARLSDLLEFGADQPGQADLVDEARAARGDHAAVRRRAIRAWSQDRIGAFHAYARAAVEREPGSIANVALLALVAASTGEMPASERRLLEDWEKRLARTHPDFAHGVRSLLRLERARARDADGAESLAAALGSPRAWRVAGPYGHVGSLELAEAFEPETTGHRLSSEPGVPVVEHRTSPESALWVGRLRASGGVAYAQTACRVETDWEGTLRVHQPVDAKVWLDGRTVFSRSVTEPDVARPRIALRAGWHRLLVKIAADGHGARLEVHLDRADGRPACVEWRPDAPEGSQLAESRVLGPAPRALDALLDAAANRPSPARLRTAALAAAGWPDAEPARGRLVAERWAARWPGDADAHLALARAARTDTDLPTELQLARVRMAIRRALSIRPAHPTGRIEQAWLFVSDRQWERALRVLDGSRATSAVLRARLAALRVGGANGAAAEPLDALAALPDPPRDLPRLAARLAEVNGDRVSAAQASAEASAREALTVDRGPADRCRRSGDRACAGRLYGALARAAPDSVAIRRAAFELVRDDPGASIEAIEAAAATALALVPEDAAIRFDVGAAALARGDRARARAAWQSLLDEVRPTDPRAFEALTALEGEAAHDLFAVDGRALLAEYRGWTPPGAFAADFEDAGRVEVLDQWVGVVLPDGSLWHVTHRITEARTRAAADEIGEIRIPEGGRLLSLRTLNAEGQEIESEGDHGKGELSFSGLGPGDAVDYRYVAWDPPLWDAAGLSAGFVFRLEDAPVYRTDFTLLVPEAMDVRIDAARGPPARTDQSWRGFRVMRWRGGPLRPLPVEPDAVPHSESTPRVGFRWGVDRAVIAGLARRRVALAVRPSRVVQQFAEDVVAGIEHPEARARALFAAVRDRIESTDARRWGSPVAHTLLARHGSRALALHALLGAVGFSSEVLLAAPHDAARAGNAEAPDPDDPGDFYRPILRLTVGDRTHWLDPTPDAAPFGHLEPRLLGAPAMTLADASASILRTPKENPLEVGWQFDLDLALDPESRVWRGTLHVDGWGPETGEVRQYLPTLSAGQQRAAMERVFADALPGVRVLDVGEVALEDADRPARFSVRVELPWIADDGQAVVPRFLARPLGGGLGNVRLPSAFTTLERRETTLLQPFSAEVVRARLRLPAGWQFDPGWDSVDLPGAGGGFRQTVEVDASGRTLRLERALRLDWTRIRPADYSAYVAWARRILGIVGRPLVARPGREDG